MRSHEDLAVWQLGMTLAKRLYQLTSQFPREEQFGLSAQLRKSAVSIPSNIAEGAARQGTKEFVQFLYIASGSASELLTQLEIANSFVPKLKTEIEELRDDAERIAMMLRKLIKSLKQNIH